MKSNPDGDFEQNINQLVHLLKKIMSSHPQAGQMPELQTLFKNQGINLNLCFFTFLPMGPEDLDELEEIYEKFFMEGDKKGEELSTDLNPSDLEFLKKYGIRF